MPKPPKKTHRHVEPADVTELRARLPSPYSRQVDFARLTGRGVSTLSAYENGHRPIPADFGSAVATLDALVDAFGLNLDALAVALANVDRRATLTAVAFDNQ